jgi:hypothetical protein
MLGLNNVLNKQRIRGKCKKGATGVQKGKSHGRKVRESFF